ncbi:hypothetical protein [Janibacter anophelis]|nr:hypothetical protein [Janibacter anophelis]
MPRRPLAISQIGPPAVPTSTARIGAAGPTGRAGRGGGGAR